MGDSAVAGQICDHCCKAYADSGFTLGRHSMVKWCIISWAIGLTVGLLIGLRG